jgi:hypothetical protein
LSSTCPKLQSLGGCYSLPSRAPSSRHFRCHFAPCPPWPILRTIFSITRRGAGCKSHTCYSIAYISDPYSLSLSYNDALRHKERRLAFDVDGLRRLAAESVNQSLADVVSLSKLAEGGFNRNFLITLRDGRQMVARIPYPLTIPKYYAIASEVATIAYLRSCGLPAPEIYGYSPDLDNAARTEYILMEFVQGSKLSDVWPILGDQEVISVTRQLTQLESQMMSLSFPAGGSLYFTKDLEKVAPGLRITPDNEHFCVGPDTRLPLWYGRRAKLDVDRGPYTPFSAFSLLRPRANR